MNINSSRSSSFKSGFENVIDNELNNIKIEKREDVDKVIKELSHFSKNQAILWNTNPKFRKSLLSLKICMQYPQLFASNTEEFVEKIKTKIFEKINELKNFDGSLVKETSQSVKKDNVFRTELGKSFLNKIPENPKEFLFIMISMLDNDLVGKIKAKDFENLPELNCLVILEGFEFYKKLIEAGADINDLFALDIHELSNLPSFEENLLNLLSAGVSLQDIKDLGIRALFDQDLPNFLLIDKKSTLTILKKTDENKKDLILSNIHGVSRLMENTNLSNLVNLDFERMKEIVDNQLSVNNMLRRYSFDQVITILDDKEKKDIFFNNANTFLYLFIPFDDLMKIPNEILEKICEHGWFFSDALNQGIKLEKMIKLFSVLDEDSINKFIHLSAENEDVNFNDIYNLATYFNIDDFKKICLISKKTSLKKLIKMTEKNLKLMLQNMEVVLPTLDRGFTPEKTEEMLRKIHANKGKY